MSFRYRMSPAPEQEHVMRSHCGQARLVWNTALEQMNTAYRRGHRVDWKQWDKELAEARQAEELEWLREGSSSMQQQSLRQLRQAWVNYFKNPEHFGRPKYRSKRRTREGFVVRDVNVRVINRKWAEILVPKVGWVKFRRDERPAENYGMAHVTLDKIGRWHVSLSSPQPPVKTVKDSEDKVVGVDRNVANHREPLSNTIATSDGLMSSIPLPSKEEVKKLKSLQRRLARQTPGSGRYEATRISIAKIHAKWTAQRYDWVEKTSTWLVANHAVTVFEALRPVNMTASASGTIENPGTNVAQKRGLNTAILRQCWGMLVTRTQQKAEASGRLVIFVPAAYTSQTCSACGYRHKKNRHAHSFKCLSCGHAEHADTNAAKNIRAAGLVVLRRGETDSGCDEQTEKGTLKRQTPPAKQFQPAA